MSKYVNGMREPDYFDNAITFVIRYVCLVPASLFLILGLIWGVEGSVIGSLMSLVLMLPSYMVYVKFKEGTNK